MIDVSYNNNNNNNINNNNNNDCNASKSRSQKFKHVAQKSSIKSIELIEDSQTSYNNDNTYNYNYNNATQQQLLKRENNKITELTELRKRVCKEYDIFTGMIEWRVGLIMLSHALFMIVALTVFVITYQT